MSLRDFIGDGERQQQTAIGEYESDRQCARLRDETDWMPSLLSQLAPYTFEAALNPGDTLEIAPAMPAGSTIVALLCLAYRQFNVGAVDAGVLLCIGITAKRAGDCRTNGHLGSLGSIEVHWRALSIYHGCP